MNKKQLRALYMIIFTAVLVGGMILIDRLFHIPAITKYAIPFALILSVIAFLLANFMVRKIPDDE